MVNKRAVDKKASAPVRFPAHFDKEVTPRLAAMCAVWGNLVACDAYTFGEALALIWARAWKLGAGYLPAPVQDELRDWLVTELSASILDDDPPPGVLSPSAALRLWASLSHVTDVTRATANADTGDQPDGQ